MISVLTGVSHEKLQVFHRWVGWMMFVLALIHTFPFIAYHISMGDMVKKWTTDPAYWTGTAALVAQAWLTFMSIGPLRSGAVAEERNCAGESRIEKLNSCFVNSTPQYARLVRRRDRLTLRPCARNRFYLNTCLYLLHSCRRGRIDLQL